MIIKVLLADDHDLVRTGVRRLLEDNTDLEVIAEATTGEEAVSLCRQHQPHVVLMDINMPGMGGIETTRKLRRRHPDIQVIALTVHGNAPFPSQLHEAGAIGYLTKGSPAEELLDAIRTVADGKPFICGEVSRQLTQAALSGQPIKTPFGTLSQREMQVLMMIVQGRKNQDISDTLCLSPKTISTYRHRLYEKLAVENDVELTFLALRHGLADFPA